MAVNVKCSDEQFLKAAHILVSRPHAIDKRVAGAELEAKLDFSQDFKVGRRVVHKEVDKAGKCLVTIDQVTFDKEGLTITISSDSPSGFAISKLGRKLGLKVNDEKCRSKAEAAFAQVSKWCREDQITLTEPALKLVDLEAYQNKYSELKAKYGKRLVEVR